ncbi:HlyD family secretion protein [uncultured Bacteroides sp.]|uniref:HlyD family secretion protein n=1 Tax=uncultured Bacteroides sp. TaxID=162156 RepID=UPI002AA6F6DF|nr:HlyD family secretion protein [uncultured Bacteroides sp.]
MEKIELRSENVRKIIGKIPPVLIRSGISIIALILVLLMVAAAFIPYPEVLEGKIIITGIDSKEAYAKGELSYSHITQVKPGMKVEIELEGYDTQKYGYQHGVITGISQKVITKRERNLFSFVVTIQSSSIIEKGMKGRVSVILSNKTLLRKILDKKE